MPSQLGARALFLVPRQLLSSLSGQTAMRDNARRPLPVVGQLIKGRLGPDQCLITREWPARSHPRRQEGERHEISVLASNGGAPFVASFRLETRLGHKEYCPILNGTLFQLISLSPSLLTEIRSN